MQIAPHNSVTDYNSLPQSWPGVFGVYEVNIGNIQLEAKMVENGNAVYTEAVYRNGFL
uniref:Glyco_hydro_65N domain-containing protein n=1 Tax=Meloidogyne hapla TaxID=6305 RepID=A0A1I8BDM4_MELHA